jgi:hypothetical protein
LVPDAEEVKSRLPGPQAFLVDNYAAHLHVDVVEDAFRRDLKLLALPANSTAHTQPCDRCVFGPLKRKWRAQVMDACEKAREEGKPAPTVLPKRCMADLLKKTLDSIPNLNLTIRSSFRATGIFPFQAQEVIKNIPTIQANSKQAVIEEVMSDVGPSVASSMVSAFVETLSSAGQARGRGSRPLGEPGMQITPDSVKAAQEAKEKAKEDAKSKKKKRQGRREKNVNKCKPKRENKQQKVDVGVDVDVVVDVDVDVPKTVVVTERTHLQPRAVAFFRPLVMLPRKHMRNHMRKHTRKHTKNHLNRRNRRKKSRHQSSAPRNLWMPQLRTSRLSLILKIWSNQPHPPCQEKTATKRYHSSSWSMWIPMSLFDHSKLSKKNQLHRR